MHLLATTKTLLLPEEEDLLFCKITNSSRKLPTRTGREYRSESFTLKAEVPTELLPSPMILLSTPAPSCFLRSASKLPFSLDFLPSLESKVPPTLNETCEGFQLSFIQKKETGTWWATIPPCFLFEMAISSRTSSERKKDIRKPTSDPTPPRGIFGR